MYHCTYVLQIIMNNLKHSQYIYVGNRYTDRRYPRRHLRLYFMFSLHLPVTESTQIANITGLTDEGPINVYTLSQIRAFSNR